MISSEYAGKWPELSAAKRALLQRRLGGRPAAVRAASQAARGIPPRDERGCAPLTFDQQETLSIIRSHDIPSAYLGTALHFAGELDLAALGRALTELVRRHESLRTTVGERDGRPVQIVGEARPQAIPVEDLTGCAPPEREARARRIAAAELRKPFDLGRGPLMRVSAVRLAADEYVLVLALDHMISDFISMGLFIRELGALYDAFAAGRPSPLAEPPAQFGDWAAWQRRRVEGGELDAQLDYWRARLADCPPPLELPFARTRPPARTFHGATQTLELPVALTDALRELSQRQAVGLYTTMLTGFNVLVHQYTGREDIILGRGVPGRTRAEAEGLIGCFVNLLALRTDLSGGPTFLDLLGRVRDVVNEAYANQDVPFVTLVERLLPGAPPTHPPLVQVIFNLYTSPDLRPLGGASIRPFDLGGEQPNDDMALLQDMLVGLKDTGRRIFAEAKYNRELFDAASVARMLADYTSLLEAAAADPGRRIGDLARSAGVASAA
jgi:Condensation domain